MGGKRVAADVNGTFYYFGYDALGSQVAVLNATGSLVGAQLYGPYGASRYNTGTIPTSIGFTGQQSDSVTGLDYYGARYYDPVAGVFLSADSVQGIEPYAYVECNPETRTDPTGHCDSWCIGANVIETVVEVADPMVGITAGFKVGGLYLNDWMNGTFPSMDDVARTRMEGDIDGVMFTFAFAGAAACVVAEPCGLGAQLGWILGGAAVTIIILEI